MTERQKEAFEAYLEHKTQYCAAKALGIGESSLQERLARIVERLNMLSGADFYTVRGMARHPEYYRQMVRQFDV